MAYLKREWAPGRLNFLQQSIDNILQQSVDMPSENKNTSEPCSTDQVAQEAGGLSVSAKRPKLMKFSTMKNTAAVICCPSLI